MYAYQLLARLKHLTLVGREDGQYQFIGDNQAWFLVNCDEDYHENGRWGKFNVEWDEYDESN